MSPGAISGIVVADKLAAVRRMLDGIRSLPLDELAAFTADPRMVAAGGTFSRKGSDAHPPSTRRSRGNSAKPECLIRPGQRGWW